MALPNNEVPVNLLALDGGGVRGVSSLVILHAIMKRLQTEGNLAELPRPCDYFHMIGGTSTGGLIAIMLGRLGMTTEEALEEYDSFAAKIFSGSNRKLFAVSDRFRASTLQKVVEELVARKGKGSAMLERSNKCKTFVCAMPTRELADPRRFRSYEVDGDRYRNCMIWEAARATSAAPTFFKPVMIKDESGDFENFVDAAMGYNNPVAWVISEAGGVFNRSRKLGCIVSIGTGTRPRSMERSFLGIKNLARVAKVLKEITTDCERSHRAMKELLQDFPGTYFRFNVPSAAEEVGLQEWRKIGLLQEKTGQYIEEISQKDEIARIGQMLATKACNGLTIGHVCYPSQAQVTASLRKAQTRGLSSQFFTGREQILGQMGQYFGDRGLEHGRAREFLIHGMGGAGKTQIALKFAEQKEASGRLDLVLWIDATDETTIEESFRTLGPTLFEDDKGDQQSKQRILAWLSETLKDWLMVYDNCGDVPLTHFLPSRQRGNIIYTSRFNIRERFPTEAAANVNEMELSEATTLLLKTSTGWDEVDILGGHDAARPISLALGRLPLAIDQAGAYIRERGCTFEQYLRLYSKHKDAMLQDPNTKGAVAENLAVYATFDISYEALEERFKENRHTVQGLAARSALQILSMVCYYHNHKFLRDTVRRAALAREHRDRKHRCPLGHGDFSLEHLVNMTDQGEWDSTNFDLGRNLLAKYSLISLDGMGDHISMHILVHSWARTRNRGPRSESAGAARDLLFNSIPTKHSKVDYIYRRRMVPHIASCEKYVDHQHSDQPLESEYDSQLALVKLEAGMLRSAEKHIKSAIERRRPFYDLNETAMIKPLEELASIYHAQGRYAEAADLLIEAIERRGGNDIENIAQSSVINNKQELGQLYILLDQPEAAVRVIGEALAGKEQRQGNSPLAQWNLLVSRNELEHTQRYLVDKTDSSRDLESGLELLSYAEELCGPDSSAAMSVKKSIARTLEKLGRYREADELYSECYEYYKDLCGEHASETVSIISSKTRLLAAQGRFTEAEGSARNVVSINSKRLGKQHLDSLKGLIDLSMAIGSQGRVLEAELLMRKARSHLEAQFTSKHVLIEEATDVYLAQLERGHGVLCEELERRRLTAASLAATRKALGDLAPSDIDIIMSTLPKPGSEGLPEWIYLLPQEIQAIKENTPDPEQFCESLQEPLTEEIEEQIVRKWLGIGLTQTQILE